jgi:hypothetical protein
LIFGAGGVPPSRMQRKLLTTGAVVDYPARSETTGPGRGQKERNHSAKQPSSTKAAARPAQGQDYAVVGTIRCLEQTLRGIKTGGVCVRFAQNLAQKLWPTQQQAPDSLRPPLADFPFGPGGSVSLQRIAPRTVGSDRAIVSAGFCDPVRNPASKPWPAWLAFGGSGRGKKGDLALVQADREMAARGREGDRAGGAQVAELEHAAPARSTRSAWPGR